MGRKNTHLRTVLAFSVAALVACSPGVPPAARPSSSTPFPSATPAPTAVKVAFFANRTPEGADERVAPAFQGAKLALDTAALSETLPVTVELVAFDTQGDPATAAQVAGEVAADAAFVAAIVAPYLDDRAALARVLDPAGVPVIDLSGGPPGLDDAGWTTWRRVVATQAEEGAFLAAHVDGLRRARDGVCLASGGGRTGAGLLRAVEAGLEADVVLRARVTPTEGRSAALVEEVAAAGCGVVVWGGFGSEGATLRRHLIDAGLGRVDFVGGSGMKDDLFVRVSGRAGEGALAACTCVDISTSTAFAAQRFIQDYQSQFGLPPGPYAVEAWDAARMVLGALRTGASSRADVLASLVATARSDGLAGTYTFGPYGELAAGAADVPLYIDRGGRWIPLSR